MAVVSIFYDKKIEQFIFDGFLYIVVGSLFSVASEKFTSAYTRMRSDEYYQENLEEIGVNNERNRHRKSRS